MATRLKPRIYLQVQDDDHMIIYYSVLYEDGFITPTGPVVGPTTGPNGELVYSRPFKETNEGSNQIEGTIPDIPATKSGPNQKIKFIAVADHGGGVGPSQDDGSSTGNSEDGDDK